MIFFAPKSIVTVLAMVVLAGCATSRGVLDVNVTELENPDEGQLVFLRNVTDDRVFSVDPPDPNIPSLKHDGDIKNKAITERAIARKRNGYGKAIGDILLPEGKTVAGLVRNEVANSLRQVGYRVVVSEPEASEFSTLDISIEKFWSWLNPGFWKVSTSFVGDIKLSSDHPKLNGSAFADFNDGAMIAASGQWLKTVEAGLSKLGEHLRATLTTAEPPPAQ